MKKKKIVIIILILIFILIAICCLLFGNKVLIINKIKKEMINRKENSISYFSIDKYNPDGIVNGNIVSNKIYKNMYVTEYQYDITINTQDFAYILFKPEKIYYKVPIENDDIYNKTFTEAQNSYYNFLNVFPDYSIEDNIFKLAKNLKISTTIFNEKNCYSITNKTDDEIHTSYIDKETLTLYGYNLKAKDINTTYTYTFKDLSNENISVEDLIKDYEEVDSNTYNVKWNEFQKNNLK